jgi:hydrogenase expression/formation protein HypE
MVSHPMSSPYFPLGKLPPDYLTRLIDQFGASDSDLVLGPGTGLDCAVIDVGSHYLVLKSDPITFADENIGWYLVHVNANDIATMAATPRWLMLTILLPELSATPEYLEAIVNQIKKGCDEIGVVVIGGHTEITHGLDFPILAGTMIGEVPKDKLITPRGIQTGDHILLSKGVPIEATALLAREVPELLSKSLSKSEIDEARAYLIDPGISVLKDSQIAMRAGAVSAMHDPTEGGLSAALWEMAQAGQCQLVIDLDRVYIPDIARKVCDSLNLDPLAAISSGALLMTAAPAESQKIIEALSDNSIACSDIGHVDPGEPMVWKQLETTRTILERPERDEITKVFESERDNKH